MQDIIKLNYNKNNTEILFMTYKIHKEIELITSYLTIEEKDKVRHALKLSEQAHSNQLRKSGDPFITHLQVKILTH